MAVLSLRDEVTALLQELVRLNTVNPPGNETVAAELLTEYLEGNDVECALYARVPERANLVARIAGTDPAAPRLLFLSHTDTVLADPREWSVDPWSGDLRDGQVWGRGALDMKGQVAAAAVALASLARDGFQPRGDLIFAATADEEVGEHYGLSWLCETQPEAVRCTWCVNEGGGDRVEIAGRAFYLCATSEKASSPFIVRVTGRSGHASMPALGDNALVKAAPLIERLGSLQLPATLTPETKVFFRGLLGEELELDAALARLRASSQRAAAMLDPMLRATVSPTEVTASRRRNVIPALCEVVCDCRLLPGQTQSEVGHEIEARLGSDGYELEWLELTGGTRSPLPTPLWTAIEDFVTSEDDSATVVPILLPGFTDSHYLRERFGTIAYGFFPMRAMDADLAALLVHSADERAAVDDLELGTRFLRDVALRLSA
jgi:acetylornithine deacetylase/succinyl-diaminopimelate desuccinylase-like protein